MGGGLSVKEMDAVAEGTAFASPRGDAVMKNRHLTLDIYLSEAIGTEILKLLKLFHNKNLEIFVKRNSWKH